MFLCDQCVDEHFPEHFRIVYTEGLQALGWETRVVAFAWDLGSVAAARLREEDGVVLWERSARRIWGRVLGSGRLFFRVLLFLFGHGSSRDAQACVVHNDPVMGLATWFWARCKGRKFVYRITALIPEAAEGRRSGRQMVASAFARSLRNWLCNRSARVVPMSLEMTRCLQDQGVAAAVMRPLESSVGQGEGNTSSVCEEHETQTLEEMVGRGCQRWLVYSGSVQSGRRLAFLIDTLAAVRGQGVGAGLLVLGVVRREEDWLALKAYAREQGVDRWIVWSAAVPEACLPSILRHADVGLSPFPPDGVLRTNSPLKTLEYIVAGVPVVGSAIPESVGVIEGSGGGVVAEYSADRFSEACLELLSMDDRDRRATMDRAAKWVIANRSLGWACGKWDEILKEALTG